MIKTRGLFDLVVNAVTGAFLDTGDGMWSFSSKGKGKIDPKGKGKGGMTKGRGKISLAIEDTQAGNQHQQAKETEDPMSKTKKLMLVIDKLAFDVEEARVQLESTKYWNKVLDDELLEMVVKCKTESDGLRPILFGKKIVDEDILKATLIQGANLAKQAQAMVKETMKLIQTSSARSVKGD